MSDTYRVRRASVEELRWFRTDTHVLERAKGPVIFGVSLLGWRWVRSLDAHEVGNARDFAQRDIVARERSRQANKAANTITDQFTIG